jgi:hypothetical protein
VYWGRESEPVLPCLRRLSSCDILAFDAEPRGRGPNEKTQVSGSGLLYPGFMTIMTMRRMFHGEKVYGYAPG